MQMTEKEILQKLSEGLSKIHNKNPLIQCITNRVTINDCANALLAIGASPVMADGADAGEMAELAHGLVLNLGSVKESDRQVIYDAAIVANRREIPLILDPVGTGSTPTRIGFIQNLIEKYSIQIIRGNWSEIQAVGEGKSQTRGVDSDKNAKPSLELLKKWAKELGVVLAVTGKEDWITDGERWIGIQNGDPRLQQITGTGCMSTSLCGAAAATFKDPFWGATLGVFLLSLAGERAGKSLAATEGSGTLRVRLMDELNLMNSEKIMKEGKVRYGF